MQKEKILKSCKELRTAYEKGLLGNMKMPEDANPGLEKMSQE